ncbi:DUF4383 domain-containing protein [Sinomonas halotolerans]|uniref:DUF4383 domain-containing protein n=1 Tax=Sinomonas halotolerans TaxID=1644133 RepID=A0ABU9X3Q0_9MICC
MTTAASHAHGVHFGRRDVQNVAMGAGAITLLVGALGFVPGITAAYGDLAFIGPDSHAMFLGVFQVSMLLNIVHLIVGAVGLTMARTYSGARSFLLWSGVLYVALGIYGFAVGTASAANVFALNLADNWAFAALGLVMMACSWLFTRHAPDET